MGPLALPIPLVGGRKYCMAELVRRAVVTSIVVGVDPSPDSRQAVEWAAGLAGQTGARVVAVHAVGLLEHERGDPRGEHLRPALDLWTAPLNRLAPTRVEHRLAAGEPVSVICDVAIDSAADLVVVGTRGEGAHGPERLGSTSQRLAEVCPCPVVIVPNRDT